ncbi:Tim10/DDP family zinc finger-domain-containing protein [Pterulicium gracile]|uniref:Mitochondrial import inner membrane translocase subunit n=1 Tax=Pterulicium gracile TaxID=1884261 RepID=A0A5C3QSV9_9AGAR|nr:Tim10/DDP family zinc finger-domain-containing protein [Pterula gracilis]
MADLNPANFNFDDATRKELSEFLEKQQAQARLQGSILTFTSRCWDKCITGTPSTGFSRSEQGCLSNCVGRFLDTSIFMVKKIEADREAMGYGNAS